jgi:hypothetical protein
LCRPSTPFFVAQKDVDARHKAGHDSERSDAKQEKAAQNAPLNTPPSISKFCPVM